MKRFRVTANHYLYFAIAFLTFLNGWPDPLSWRAWTGALAAGLIALKAKKSDNKVPDEAK